MSSMLAASDRPPGPAGVPGPGSGRVAARQQVPVPAQDRFRPGQQSDPAEHVVREAVQQGGQECPVGGGEPRPVRAQLPLQDRDLVPQHQDLGALIPVAHRKQPQ